MIQGKIAKKGGLDAQRAGNALLGDIYTRRWVSEVGKGKKKKLVEHELKVNPVSVGLGVVAAGVAAVGAGIALWTMQLRADRTEGFDYYFKAVGKGTTGDLYAWRLTRNGLPVAVWTGNLQTIATKIKENLPLKYAPWSQTGYDAVYDSTNDRYVISEKWHTDEKNTYGLAKREGFIVDVG